MRIRLTDPKFVEQVLDKLDQQWPLGEFNRDFIQHCVTVIKEKLAAGQVVYLESVIDNTEYGICQVLSYWTLDDVPTDEDYLNSSIDDKK